jgi:hypothetical protein
MSDLNKGQIIVFKKMCKMVGADFNSIDFSKDGWYNQYEWTVEQEKEFFNWLSKKIRNNKTIRNDVTTFSFKPNKIRADKTAHWFVFMWGWKLKE